MKAYLIYMMWDKSGKVLNMPLKAVFRTKEMAETWAERWYPKAQCGWKILEYPLYG